MICCRTWHWRSRKMIPFGNGQIACSGTILQFCSERIINCIAQDASRRFASGLDAIQIQLTDEPRPVVLSTSMALIIPGQQRTACNAANLSDAPLAITFEAVDRDGVVFDTEVETVHPGHIGILFPDQATADLPIEFRCQFSYVGAAAKVRAGMLVIEPSNRTVASLEAY
jgi:hypothetical protein